MDIKEIAEKWIQSAKHAFQEGNFDAAEQIMSYNIIFHMPPAPDIMGFETLKQHITNNREMISDLKYDAEYLTGDSTVCAIAFKETFTLKVEHPVSKIPAGTTVNIDGVYILRCENDKVAEMWMKGSTTTN